MVKTRSGFVSNSSSSSFIVCLPDTRSNRTKMASYLRSDTFGAFIANQDFPIGSIQDIQSELNDSFTDFFVNGYLHEGRIMGQHIGSSFLADVLRDSKVKYTLLDNFETDSGKGIVINVCTAKKYRKIKQAISMRIK